MTHPRLQRIYQEAGRLFDEKGFANTKMAEIANASGIAVGTMYSSFTGKDAVLSFVIYATLDKDFLSSDITLPIKPIESSRLTGLLRKILDNAFDSVLIITDAQGNVTKTFSALMGELFDLFADYLLALDNIEKNAGVLKELYEEYLPRKAAYFNELENCLKLYIRDGQIQPLSHVSSHVRFLTNTLSWWALNANLSIPNQPIPREVSREICIGIIKRAYGA